METYTKLLMTIVLVLSTPVIVLADSTWSVIEDIPHPGYIQDCIIDGDGVIWVCFNQKKGFFRYYDGTWNDEHLTDDTQKTVDVMDIAVGPKGCLWLKTSSNLIKYNKVNIERIDCPSLLFSNDGELIFNDDGILWITSMMTVASYDGKDFRIYDKNDGLPGDSCFGFDIIIGPDKRPYISLKYTENGNNDTQYGLYVYDDGEWHVVQGPGPDGIYNTDIVNMMTTPSGELLVEMDNKLYRVDDGSWSIINDQKEMSRYAIDSGGILWAMSSLKGICRLTDGDWQDFSGVTGLPSDGYYTSLIAHPDGGMLVYSKDKIAYYSQDTPTGPDDETVNHKYVSINEIMASNSTTYSDSEGKYFDWIELYNTGDETANLYNCGLSDREDNPFKWVFPAVEIPPNASLLVFASGQDITTGAELHTNFKISTDGETLVLTAPDGTRIDSAPAQELRTDISWGRNSNGDWMMFGNPTPGKKNTTEGSLDTAGIVDFSIPGGCYRGSVTLAIYPENNGAVIRYTTDGSVPTENSSVYNVPLTIQTTTAIRACEFIDGMLPGKTITHTYFINSTHKIPVVSLTTEHFDELYAYSNNEGNLTDTEPYDSIERPLHIEMYEPGSTSGFSLDAGFGIQGILASMLPLKSLSIFARNRYGDNDIDYRIFPNIARDSFDSIILRTSGNDCLDTMLKDGFMTSLIDDLDLDTMGYRPAAVYVNGEYFGIHNIREKMNEDYLAAHHNIDPDNVDMLEFLHKVESPNVIEGDADHYNAMISYLKNNDIADPDNYNRVNTQMDMDNFINYNVFQIFIANWDWPHMNMKWWRQKNENGRWRWLVYDLDAGFNLEMIEEFYRRDYLERTSDFQGGVKADPWTVYLLSRLLENEKFKHEFINRMADHLNTIFQVNTVIQKIQNTASVIEPEMPKLLERWEDVINDWDSFITVSKSMEEWYEKITELEEFAKARPAIVRQNYIDFFSLSGTADLTLSSSDGGGIHLNSLDLDSFPWSGTYFRDVPVTVTARPDLGWRFVRWEGASSSTDASIELMLTEDTELTVVFEEIGNDIVIDISQSPYEVSGDLVVAPGMTLTIEAGVEMVMSADANIIVQGVLTIEGAEDNPVVFEADGSHWGAICFDNASGESTISHALIRNGRHGTDSGRFPATVSGLNSDFTVGHVTFRNNVQGVFADGGNVTVRECIFDDTNTDEPINIKNGWGLVEGCRFYDVQEQDAVDFDGVSGGIIRNNRIYGSNDDGIDIGDGCSDVRITGNRVTDCADKAISIGEASKNITVERCILADSMYGIAVKDNSTASIDHVTFYGNDIAVAGYEKGEDAFGGGSATVTNSILAGSGTSTVLIDDLSALTISYCLSDLELLPGDNNIQADPMLLSPEHGGFLLVDASPAIDSGDPGSVEDPDRSRADLGALAFRADAFDLVITEINYNPAGDFDTEDWIEIYNSGGESLDLGGWILGDENDDNLFVLPEGTSIKSGGYLVLCRDDAKFSALFPHVNNALGDFNFGLNNAGDAVRLFDSDGVLRDAVAYDDESPWPVASDGSGATLALKLPDLDNSRPESWGYSSGYGTPGVDNTGDVGVDEATPLAFSIGPNYPNPFNPVTTIPFSISMASHVRLSVYSVLGQCVATLVDERMSAGKHTVQFDSKGLSSGVYLYRIEAENFTGIGSMLLVK